VFDLPKFGTGVCLARLAALLDRLAIDRERLQRASVVVTGSNGKGSTAAFCASIGQAAGLRTGLFTSPHLYRFNERFQIDGEPIDDARLIEFLQRVEAAIEWVSRTYPAGQFGAFEAQFALACLYFQAMGCEFAVFEAGIGGRYDPVRLVGATTTCVTSVDYEHTVLLGDTLELICSDKSDACAAGGRIVYGENCLPLQPYLAEYNRNRAVEGIFIGDQIRISDASRFARGQSFDLHFRDHRFRSLDIGLAGAFQRNNAAVAASLFLLWAPPDRFAADTITRAVAAGLREARWPARLEVIRDDPMTVIDVGHTPDGIRQALTGLKAAHGNDGWLLVTGVSRDKKADDIIKLLAPAFDLIVCTRPYHKGSDAAQIAKIAATANPNADIHVAETIEDAVALSSRLATEMDRKIYVAGGLFLAIEYAAVTRGDRAHDLAFF
jgi:dihydrofolate synthase/folylpolyglutamate synthase